MSQEVDAAVVEMSEAIAMRVVNTDMNIAMYADILASTLPALAVCFNRDDEPDPTQVRLRVVEQNALMPDRLRRRMTAKIMRESPNRTITKLHALALAEAIIAEILERSDEEVSTFCLLHGQGLSV